MRNAVAVKNGRASFGRQGQREEFEDTTVEGRVQAPGCGVDLFTYGGRHGGEYE